MQFIRYGAVPEQPARTFSPAVPTMAASRSTTTSPRTRCAVSVWAAGRVRIADGPKHRIFDRGVSRMPGDEVWIIGERRATGERQYYISNLPAHTTL